MRQCRQKLVIEGNSLYEIDLECMNNRKRSSNNNDSTEKKNEDAASKSNYNKKRPGK